MFGIDSSVKLKAGTMARKVFDKLGMDEKAEAGAFKLVMAIFIVAILVGALIPTAIESLISGRNASWSSGVLSSYDALPILIVVAIIAVIAGIAYKAFND